MTEHELVRLALDAREHAYAPYSGFRVGAALECADGTIFTGCNIENAAYGATVCAERTALFKAVSEGQREFVRIAIAGDSTDFCWPCGTCRQVMREFAPALTVIAANREGKFTLSSLEALLPNSFGPAHLL